MTFPPVRRYGGDAGSLAMALLIILIGVSLAGLLGPVALVQIGSTRSEVRRNHALYAAQAGLDAVIAQVRAADDGSGNGIRASLPCGPLSGNVGGGTAEKYQVTIYYLAIDPQAQMTSSATWFAANDITCTTGSGPSPLPAYVVAFSTGSEAGISRTLRGAYRLRTTNQNIAGGRIHIFTVVAGDLPLCMDSGTTITPTATTPLKMQTCDSTRKQQIFAYNQDDTILLVNSVTSAQPTGMCLDAGSPQAEGALVKFQPCVSPAVARQQWQMNGNAQFQGMNSDGTTNSFVFQLVSPNVNPSTVKITAAPTWTGYNNSNSFSPEAAVGPGNAGPQNHQLVNFNQFGRCFDLTGGNYQYGYMIAWPCKPSWNQSYYLPTLSTSATSATAGLITLTVPAGQGSTPQGLYCLQSPRSTAAYRYAVMVPCTSTATTAALQWRAYGYTGSYGSSYRILDVDGNCLQPTDPNAATPDLMVSGAQQISKIIVQPCTDATLQKWNADPNILAGLSMKYVGEN